MKIAMVAPPWLPIPPGKYGGTEGVIDMLVRTLSDMGHEVVLYAREGSTCPVEVRVPKDMPWSSGTLVVESTWAIDVYDDITREQFDIVHDHTITGAVQAAYANIPVVTTAHWPFTGELSFFSRRLAERTPLIAISQTQANSAPEVPVSAVIHHGIDLQQVPFYDVGGDYLAFLGRMVPEKGADIAVHLAHEQGLPLKMAARLTEEREIKFFEEKIKPLLGGDIEYVGEVGGKDKFDFLGNARALINPIRWEEPFGMVMIESLACGTPVIAFPNGAASEIIETEKTGFLCEDEMSLAIACKRIDEVKRSDCRAAVESSFSAERMALDHLRFYEKMIKGYS